MKVPEIVAYNTIASREPYLIIETGIKTGYTGHFLIARVWIDQITVMYIPVPYTNYNFVRKQHLSKDHY